MHTRTPWMRRPLSGLGKLTVAALLITTLGYAAELFSLGLDREVSSVVAVLALATGVAASGRPFTPVLGALIAGLIMVMNPFLLFNLSNPSNFPFFAAALVQAAATSVAVLAGVAASVQQLRRRNGAA